MTGTDIINVFSSQFRESLPPEFIILINAMNLGNVTITEVSGEGGLTRNGGEITIPTDTGPGIVPMNSVEAYTTFHQYDKDSALIHELGHAILHELGLGDISTDELNNAVLAAATREAIIRASKNGTDMVAELKVILGYDKALYNFKQFNDPGDDDYDSALVAFKQSAQKMWDVETRLQIAGTPDASFENVFNLERDVYEISGLSGDTFLYRTGYASHLDVGLDSPFDVDHEEWTSFGGGQAKGIVDGNGQTMINNGQSLAWLGNQYNNSLTTGNGNDYLDGGHGNDTLEGKGGKDILIGGSGNDTLRGGDGDDTLYGDMKDGITTPTELNGVEISNDDTLIGGEGADTLIGGIGFDTYYSGDGDTIIDSDGKGEILLSNVQFLDGGIDYLGDGTYTNGTLSYKLDGTTLTITDSATQQTVTVKDVKPSEIIEGEDRMLDVGLGIHLESSTKRTTAPIGATYVTVHTTDEWHQYQIPIYATDRDGKTYLDHYIDNPAYVVHWAGSSFSADDNSNTINLVTGGGAVDGAGGDDTFYANSGSDTLYGGDGNDTFYANNDGNVIDGGSGADTIVVGNNATIETGSGADKVTAGDYATVTNKSGRDSITTGDYANITGSMWAESISVGSDSTVDAGDGNNTIDASDNATIKSGSGSDTIKAGNTANIFGGTGNDTITVGNDSKVDGGSGLDSIFAQSGNELVGGEGNDSVTAVNSNTITTGNGSDSVKAGDQNSIITADGSDSVNAGNTNTIDTGSEADSVVAGNSNTITTASGSDSVNAGNTNTIDTGSEADSVVAGNSNTITTASGSDSVNAGSNNSINTGSEGDTVSAVDGNTIITAGGSDIVHARSNNIIDTGSAEGSSSPDNSTGATISYLDGGGTSSTIDLESGDDDSVYAVDGNTITTASGSDNVHAGSNNSIDTGSEDDSVVAGNSNTITTASGMDSVNAGSNNSINTGSEGDTVNAGSGNLIRTETGEDALYVYGNGNDIDTGLQNDYLSLGGDNNKVVMGGGDDLLGLTSNMNLNNTINTESGNDRVSGKLNNSSLSTELGEDIINLNGAGNTISTGADRDNLILAGDVNTVTMGQGEDNLDLLGNGNNINTGSEADVIMALGNANTIITEDGNDTISTRGNNITIDMGKDDDTLSFSMFVSAWTSKQDFSRNQINMGDGNDNLDFYGYNFGGSYNATAADNNIDMGNGNDTANIRSIESSLIDMGDGDNLLNLVFSKNSIVNSGNGIDKFVLSYSKSISIYSNAGDDIFYGALTDGSLLDTGKGNDTINVGLYGESNSQWKGSQTFTDSEIKMGDGSDSLKSDQYGSFKFNKVDMGTGDDNVLMAYSAQYNEIKLGDGNDKLSFWGYEGNSFFGEDGNDLMDIYVYDKDAVYDGGKGDDVLRGHLNEQIRYGRQNLSAGDTYLGGTGNDTIIAEYGTNFIDGGEDNDRIEIAYGKATIEGGSGDDKIFINSENAVHDLYYENSNYSDRSSGVPLMTLDATISDNSGNDTVYFENNIAREDIIFTLEESAEGQDIVFHYGEKYQHTLRVKPDSVETFVMTDGSSISAENIKNSVTQIALDTGYLDPTDLSFEEIISSADLKQNIYDAWDMKYVEKSFVNRDYAVTALQVSLQGASPGYASYAAFDVEVKEGVTYYLDADYVLAYDQNNEPVDFFPNNYYSSLVLNGGSVTWTSEYTGTMSLATTQWGSRILFIEGTDKPLDSEIVYQELDVVSYATTEEALLSSQSTVPEIFTYKELDTNSDNEVVHGTDGADQIESFSGDDTIEANKGDDSLNGGNGNDTYIFNRGDNNDTIIDRSNPVTVESMFGPDVSNEYFGGEGNGYTTWTYNPNEAPSNDTLVLKDDIQAKDLEFFWDSGSSNDLVLKINPADGAQWNSRSGNIEKIIANYVDKTLTEWVYDEINLTYVQQNRILTSGDLEVYSDKALRGMAYQLDQNQWIASSNSFGQITNYIQVLNDSALYNEEYREGADTIRIQEYYDKRFNLENIIVGGKTLSSQDILDSMSTNSAETIRGVDWENNTIRAMAGHDAVIGGILNDDIAGEVGNDYINGRAGDDIYRYNIGDGHDKLEDTTEGYEVLSEGEDTTYGTVNMRVDYYGGTGSFVDKPTINNENLSGGYDKVVFGEGINIENIGFSAMPYGQGLYVGYGEQKVFEGKVYDWRVNNIGNSNDFEFVTGKQGHDYNEALTTYADDIILERQFEDDAAIEEFVLDDGTKITNTSIEKGLVESEVYINENKVYLQAIQDEGRDVKGYVNQFMLDKWQRIDKTLNGTDMSDVIDSGQGDDTVLAGAGNDIIDGGFGEDDLQGGSGDDTYIYNRWDGSDSITDELGSDTLSFGADIQLSDLIADIDLKTGTLTLALIDEIEKRKAEANGEVYTPDIGVLTQKLTLNEWISNSGRIENFTFADGTSLNAIELYNHFFSTEGDDTQYGIEGNNIINSLGGNDTITTGDGDDFVNAGSGQDSIDTGAGNDTIYGAAGDDSIKGGQGNDLLKGEEGDDTLSGGAGNDVLEGGSGNDTLNAGSGTDRLEGGSGDDVYVIDFNQGSNLVIDESGNDRLSFKDGVLVSDVNVTYEGDDLIVTLEGTEIRLSNWYDTQNRIEIFEFANGDIFNVNDIINFQDENMKGVAEGTYFKSDTADDALLGGLGNDIYEVGLNQGNDTVIDMGGVDKLLFKDGITSLNLEVSYEGNDLIVSVEGTIVRLTDWYNSENRIETFEFDNGEVLDINGIINQIGTELSDNIKGTELNETIESGAGDDIIIGARGDDTLKGGSGNDTYVYTRGDGKDTIIDLSGSDTLSFEGDIILSDLIAEIDPVTGDLTLALIDRDTKAQAEANGEVYNPGVDTLFEQIVIKDWSSLDGRIENFSFSDGTVVSAAELYGFIVATEGDDNILGLEGDNIIDALGGDDILSTGSGNDQLSGGKGDDTLTAGDGDDTYYFGLGDGIDNIFDIGGNDTIALKGDLLIEDIFLNVIVNDLIISLKDGSSATLKDWFNDENCIENITDSNGKSVKVETLLLPQTINYDINTLEDETFNGIVEVTDYSGTELIYSITQEPEHGTLVLDPQTGETKYTPAENYYGNDVMEVTVTNGYGLSSSSTISFEIEAVNDAPIIAKESENINLVNMHDAHGKIEVIDVEGDSLSFTIVSKPTHGVISIDENGNWDYKADLSYNGSDSVVVGIDDGNGGISTTILNFTVEGYIYEGGDLIITDNGDDTLVMDTLDKNDLSFSRIEDSLFITVKDQGTVTLSNYFSEVNSGVEKIRTAQGDINLDRDLIQEDTRHYIQAVEGMKYLLVGTDHTNHITGTSSDDILFADGKHSFLDGSAGNDTLFGGYGLDRLKGSDGNDNIYGHGGDDFLFGEDGDDALIGGNGSDTLDGGLGNDYLWGDSGNDNIKADRGDDFLSGGSGFDKLEGGGGNDTYFFEKGDESATINDYAGQGSKKLEDAGNDTVKFGEGITHDDISFIMDDGNLYLQYGDSDMIMINDQDNSMKKIEKFELNDGSFLTHEDVEMVVQQLNAYATDQGMATFNNETICNNAEMMNIVASAWQA